MTFRYRSSFTTPGMPRPASWQGPVVAYTLWLHQKAIKSQASIKLPCRSCHQGLVCQNVMPVGVECVTRAPRQTCHPCQKLNK